MLSRVIRVGTTLIVLGLMTVSASAQQGGQRGPGGRGFGGGPGGQFGAGGGPAELLRLLAAPEIRKEVKLSDEGYAAVEKAQESLRPNFTPPGRDASDGDREKARTEFAASMKASNEKAQALLDEVLPPEGLDRLLGLYVQLRGDSSVVGELPAKKLGLSDDDKKKIEEALTKVRQEAFGQGARGGERPDFNSEEFQKRMADMRKKSDEAVVASLSDAQKKALTELKGAKFEFPESVRNMGRGGPGGPGGPGGQGRPRGGRPPAE